MKNENSQKYYSFFVHFNPYLRHTKWDNIANYAQKYYTDFLNQKDYGDNLISTTFSFYVQEKIDINEQKDVISTSSYLGIPKIAKLSLHFDYKKFNNASECEQKKISLNAILYLLKYWNTHLKVPKGNPLNEIIYDFENNLKEENFYIKDDDIDDIFIKIIEPFRVNFMEYNIMDIEKKQVLFDIEDIEKFINNNIYNIDFGKSIKTLYISYDIFDFDNPDSMKKYYDEDRKFLYGKDKSLSIMQQYDSNHIIYNEFYEIANKLEQINYFHKGILDAIKQIKTMQKKPKYFDVDKFYFLIDKIFLDYEKKLD